MLLLLFRLSPVLLRLRQKRAAACRPCPAHHQVHQVLSVAGAVALQGALHGTRYATPQALSHLQHLGQRLLAHLAAQDSKPGVAQQQVAGWGMAGSRQ